MVDLSERLSLPEEKLVLSLLLQDHLHSAHLLLIDLLAAPVNLSVRAYNCYLCFANLPLPSFPFRLYSSKNFFGFITANAAFGLSKIV